MLDFLIMRLLLLLLLLAGNSDKPRLETRAFPVMSTIDTGRGCSIILLTAEIKGVEDERWYCPEIEWTLPDETVSIEESDCAPFSERDYYPRIWSRRVCYPSHPHGNAWITTVRLKKSGKVIAQAEIRAYVK